jgi:hypothetical protein
MFSNPNGAEVNPLAMTTDQITPQPRSILMRGTGTNLVEESR